MSKTPWKYLLVTEDLDVFGTDEERIADNAEADGVTQVIDLSSSTYAFNGETAEIKPADPNNWPDPEADDEDPEVDDSDMPENEDD